MRRSVSPDELTISVMPDGATSWLGIVDWPDGRRRTREFGSIVMKGLPVVITDQEAALSCLEAWVPERPDDWRPLGSEGE